MNDSPSLLACFTNDPTASSDTREQWVADLATLRWPAAAGAGLGWIQEARALVQRRPDLALSPTLVADTFRDQRSRVLVAAGGTAPRTRSTDLPPFRFHGWLAATSCMPRSSISADARNALDALLPDPLRRSLEGESVGEVIASVVLGSLYRAGLLQAPAPAPRDVVACVVDSLRGLLDAARLVTMPFDLLVSNSRFVLAVAGPTPGLLQRRDGFSPLRHRADFARIERPSYLGVMIGLGASAPSSDPGQAASLTGVRTMALEPGSWVAVDLAGDELRGDVTR